MLQADWVSGGLLLAPLDLVNANHLVPSHQDGPEGHNVLRVTAPHAFQQTLLNEVVDELPELNLEQHQFVLSLSVDSADLRVLDGVGFFLQEAELDFLREIRPEETAHSLHGVTQVVGCRDVEVPVETLQTQEALHLHELLLRVSVSNQPLGVCYLRYAIVLLVGLGCQQDAAQSNQVQVLTNLLVCLLLHLCHPLGFVAVFYSYPHVTLLLLLEPSLKEHRSDVRSLELEAQAYAALEDLDYSFFPDFLHKFLFNGKILSHEVFIFTVDTFELAQ